MATKTPTPGETKRKPRKSKFTDTGGQDNGLTEIERQLLMVDDDRDAIMYERDSNKIGRYMIEQKNDLLNEQLKKEMKKNLIQKKNMRSKMLAVDNKQELGMVQDGESAKKLMNKQLKVPISFKQNNGYNPMEGPIQDDDSLDESVDFGKDDIDGINHKEAPRQSVSMKKSRMDASVKAVSKHTSF